jgi:hypothetical protein
MYVVEMMPVLARAITFLDPNRIKSKMLLKNNGRYSDLYRIEADLWKLMGGVAWHQ